MAFIY
jgi:hypothetical protein